jgi:hypothetical protein
MSTPVRTILAVAALAAVTACENPTEPAAPAQIVVCETNTATLCANWNWVGDHYVADWAQGSHATITVQRFDADMVIFVRDDPSGTSAGMHAVYQADPDGNSVTAGVVTWTHNGASFSGRWDADW